MKYLSALNHQPSVRLSDKAGKYSYSDSVKLSEFLSKSMAYTTFQCQYLSKWETSRYNKQELCTKNQMLNLNFSQCVCVRVRARLCVCRHL